MLCYRCGKETHIAHRAVCEECFFELNPIKLERIEISMCNCRKYRYKKTWRENFEIEEDINGIIADNLILPENVSINEIGANIKKIEKNRILIEINLKLNFDKKEIFKVLNDEIKIKRDQCENCRNLQSYDAILQFRDFEPDTKDINHELISKIEKTKHGIDFYITRKGYARKIAKKFKKIGFTVKETQKLFGIDESGKRKSRITISIRKR